VVKAELRMKMLLAGFCMLISFFFQPERALTSWERCLVGTTLLPWDVQKGQRGGRRSVFIRLLSPLHARSYRRTQDCPWLSRGSVHRVGLATRSPASAWMRLSHLY
jgi:hypothetical protein